MSTGRARYLRNNPTEAELKLWQALSRYRPPFTRQLEIIPAYADLACRRARLVVEIDGSQHADSRADDRRTSQLEERGWLVIRFWNNDVLTNVEGVLEAIVLAGNPRLPEGEAFEPIASRAGRPRKPRSRSPKTVED